jgi:multicomponent Na+:H+ antiporter subunit C
MTAAIAVGILAGAGVYLILQPHLLRVIFGFVLLGHGVNLLLVAAGGMARRRAPLLGTGDLSQMADPLPQAFVLTAIVITFGITIYLLALVRADQQGDDGGDGEPGGGGPDEPCDETAGRAPRRAGPP